MTAMCLGHEVRVVQEAGPIDHPGQDRHRRVAARPAGAADPGIQGARLRVPGPVQVVGEASQALELGRDANVARRRRGNADGGLHPADDIGAPHWAPGASTRSVARPYSTPWACASRSSPRSASHGRRRAGWPMSLTRSRGPSVRSAERRSTASSTSSFRATGRVPVPDDARSVALSVPDPRSPGARSTSTS